MSGEFFGVGGREPVRLLYQALDPDQVVNLDSGFWGTVITLPGLNRDLDSRHGYSFQLCTSSFLKKKL